MDEEHLLWRAQVVQDRWQSTNVFHSSQVNLLEFQLSELYCFMQLLQEFAQRQLGY